jgi:hypothetical protein
METQVFVFLCNIVFVLFCRNAFFGRKIEREVNFDIEAIMTLHTLFRTSTFSGSFHFLFHICFFFIFEGAFKNTLTIRGSTRKRYIIYVLNAINIEYF